MKRFPCGPQFVIAFFFFSFRWDAFLAESMSPSFLLVFLAVGGVSLSRVTRFTHPLELSAWPILAL